MADGENRGRPPYEPNDRDRRTVKSMARFVTHDEIALVLGISDETMRKYYRQELDTAKTEADVAVGQSLILQAVGGPDQDWKQAIPAATIFYAKTRIKAFREEVNLRHTGSIGIRDLGALTDEQLTALDAILEALPPAEPGGGEGGDSKA